MSDDKLIKKIRALLAKANDKSVTEHEAAMFAAKAQELLIANNLAMTDMTREDVDRGGIADQQFQDKWTSPSRKHVLNAVCEFYMCKILIHGHLKQVTVIGRPHNVAVAVEMADYLIKTVVRLSNEFGRETGGHVISFRKGAMLRLARRLEQMQREREKKDPATSSRELVLFKDESALVHDFMHSKFLVAKSRKARRMTADQKAFAAGAAAGGRISLQDQLS